MNNVDEMSDESFPASDPPSYSTMHVGPPAPEEEPTESVEPRQRLPWGDWLALAQGALFVATGAWPILSPRSFTAVLGRGRDVWLTKAFGFLAMCVGLHLLQRKRSAALLGATSAAALVVADVATFARGGGRKLYLADALLGVAVAGGWVAIRAIELRRRDAA